MNNLPHIRYLRSDPVFPPVQPLTYPQLQRELLPVFRRSGLPDRPSLTDDRMTASRDAAWRLPA